MILSLIGAIIITEGGYKESLLIRAIDHLRVCFNGPMLNVILVKLKSQSLSQRIAGHMPTPTINNIQGYRYLV